MKYEANTVEGYIAQLPEDRREIITELRAIINENIPDGFEETMSYGMIGWVVPHSIYPNGYHCTPELPLPFLSIASQKNFIGFYHMGIYANPELLKWFTEEYPKYSKYKLDMGKSCVRLKRMNDIPFDLIRETVQKMTVKEWIDLYEGNLKR